MSTSTEITNLTDDQLDALFTPNSTEITNLTDDQLDALLNYSEEEVENAIWLEEILAAELTEEQKAELAAKEAKLAAQEAELAAKEVINTEIANICEQLITEQQAVILDWSSRVYKSSKKFATVGNHCDFDSKAYSINYINENRRRRVIDNAGDYIKEIKELCAELQNLEYCAFMVRVERVKNTEIYFNEEFYKRILKNFA